LAGFQHTHLELNLLHILVQNCGCLRLGLRWGWLWLQLWLLLLFIVTHRQEQYVLHNLPLLLSEALPVTQNKCRVGKIFALHLFRHQVTPLTPLTPLTPPTARFCHQHIQSLPFYILLLLEAKDVFLIGLWLSWGSVLVPDLSVKLIEQRDAWQLQNVSIHIRSKYENSKYQKWYISKPYKLRSTAHSLIVWEGLSKILLFTKNIKSILEYNTDKITYNKKVNLMRKRNKKQEL
jgi:hypothetical protein